MENLVFCTKNSLLPTFSFGGGGFGCINSSEGGEGLGCINSSEGGGWEEAK